MSINKHLQRSAVLYSLLGALFSAQPVLANQWIDHTELVAAFTYGYATHEQQRLTSELELLPTVDFNAGDALSGRVSLRIRGENQDLWLPDEPDFDSYSGAARPYNINRYWLAELRDAYVDISLPNGQLRLGKQQIVWGALDGIKVLDALNPQSFERFILEDFDASRIGLWSAYLDLTLGSWRTELALIPDNTTHFIPEPGAWMAFTAPRYRYGLTNSGAPLLLDYEEPDRQNPSAGLRISRYIGGVDLQLIAISGPDFEPLGELGLRNGLPLLTTYHEQRELYGFNAETSFSAFALRSEVSFSPQRSFNTLGPANNLGAVELDQWRGAIGLDINAPLDVFVNLQYLHDEVERPPADLVRERKERIFTAFLRRSFAYDALDVELRFYQSIEYHDRLMRAAVAYEINDNMSVKLAYEEFDGDPRGPFGQFDRRDQVNLTWEITL